MGVSAVPSSGASNLQIQARCWQGEPGHRPESDSQILSLSKEVTTTASGETNIVAGQVPENTDVGLGQDDYSCNFGFRQRVSALTQMPSNDEVYDITGSAVGDLNRCGVDINCYIVAGSNSIEPVQVTVNNIDPSGNIQTKLENAASPEATSVFNPFPEGGRTASPRNPLDVCRLNHGCPTYN